MAYLTKGFLLPKTVQLRLTVKIFRADDNSTISFLGEWPCCDWAYAQWHSGELLLAIVDR